MVCRTARLTCRSVLFMAALASDFALHGDPALAQSTVDAAPWNDPLNAVRLRQAVDQTLTLERIPGAAVSIRQGNQRWTTYAGIADVETGTPPRSDTNFGYRSVTKSFVSTVVLQLASEGRIGLDTPVGQYVTGVPSGDTITIRQLAAMRSGLFNYTASTAFVNEFLADPSRNWKPQEILRFGFAEPLQFKPGTSYQYSNTNTVLLGEVIAAVTGNNWSDEVSRRLSRPLGLTSIIDPGAGAIPAPTAVGYIDDGSGPQSLAVFNGTGQGASGALVGAVEDLEGWGKAVGTGATLSKADFVARLKSFGSTKSDPKSPEYDSYGFGMGEISGWIGHTGNGLGFESLVMYDRANDRTISILFNASNEDADAPAHLFRNLLGVLGWTEPSNQRQVAADAATKIVDSGTVWTGLVSGAFGARAAVYADNGGVAIADGPVQVAPIQDYLPAIFVTRNGHVALERGGTITASVGGDGAYLHGNGGAASLSLAGIDIALRGNSVSGTGVDVRDNGTASLNGVRIAGSALAALHAGGDTAAAIIGSGLAIDLIGGHGAWATDNGTIDLSGSRILLRGPGHGLIASSTGAPAGIDARGLSVETFSPASFGVVAHGVGASVSLMDSLIVTHGSRAHGINLGGGATVALANSAVWTEGSEAAAVVASQPVIDQTPPNPGAPSPRGGLTLLNSALSAASGTAIAAAVDLSVNASGSLVTGAITRAGNATLDVTLRNGSVWTIPATGVLGPSRVSSIVNRDSSIIFGPPDGGPYRQVEVTDYHGERATIAMNAFLGPDGAAGNRLIIKGGSATGDTRITVQATGGGGLTVGDGIRLVEVRDGGRTDPTAFWLGGRVAASAYNYNLYRGGASGTDDWFLRSTRPGSGLPDLRPEVPVALALPAMASRYGLALLGSYAERADARAAVAGDGRGAVWVRAFGETGSSGSAGGSEATQLQRFNKYGPSFDMGLAGFEAGADIFQNETSTGARNIGGFFIGAGAVSGNVGAVYGGRAGRTALNAYSLGGYWTRFAPNGWYVDAVLQGTFYDQVNAASASGETLKTNGWGFVASLESGYPIALGGAWGIEPRVQMMYQRLSFGKGSDRFGQISFDDTDTAYGRVGARLTHGWRLTNGHTLMTWADANIWQALGDGARATFSALDGTYPVAFSSDPGGTWAQFGLGVRARLTEDLSLFVTGQYGKRLGNETGNSIGGRLGLRATW